MTVSSILTLAGRALIVIIFVNSGLAKIADIPGSMAYTQSGGLPGIMLFPAIAIEVLAGLAVLVGYQTRYAALSLALFCVVSGYLFHYVPAQSLEGMDQMMQMIGFWKNIAIAGGFLILAGNGAGALSLDARLGNRVATA